MVNETPVLPPAPPNQPDALDRLIAFFAAAATAVILFVTSTGVLHPEAWRDAAVAANLVPPDHLFPGIGRLVEAGLFRLLGLTGGMRAIGTLGCLAAGMATGFVYLMLRELLPAVLALRTAGRRWSAVLERFVAFAGTAAFICAEPIRRLFDAFTAETMLLLGTVLLMRYGLRLLHYGRFGTAYGCLFLLGFLSAESPFGFILTGGTILMVSVARLYAWRPDLAFLNPMLMELSKWRLSLFYAAGFLLTLCADAWFFLARGGLEAGGFDYAGLAVDWVLRYGRILADAATPLGWTLLVLFAIAPLALALLSIRRATDDDAFLPYKTGLLYLLVFACSLAPLTTFRYLRFWSWTVDESIRSGFLLSFGLLALVLAFTLALSVFIYDIWCRDHRRIAVQRFPELSADEAFVRQPLHGRWRKTVSCVIVAGIVFSWVPGQRERATREMSRILREAVAETAHEAAGSDILVTDGALDDALRLAASPDAKPFEPLSMMSGREAYETFLRKRVAVNAEEREILELSTADALRHWVREKPERFKRLALQLGFEVWRGNRTGRPPMGGLAARADLAESVRKPGIARAHALAKRILALHASGAWRLCEDRLLKEKLLYVQWRLARFAAWRAEDADRAGQIATARAESALSEKLDEANPQLRRLRDAINWIRRREGDSLTPREGLRIALERADFALARRYATPVINTDPGDADANFGMGMSYFIEAQYAQAEQYLKTALQRRPDEPALLNNLAICCYRTSRYREALAYAERAVRLLPDAPAVRNTYNEIKKTLDRAEKR